MYMRTIQPDIERSLSASPVTLLNGARQTGKSTLARVFVESGALDDYVTLDDLSTRRAAVADPDGFIASLSGNSVIDEIQHAPDLFRAIKLSVDQDRRPGRFMLTGSANVHVLPRLSESLAGRVFIDSLWPLSVGETLGVRESFVDRVFDDETPAFAPTPIARKDLLRRVVAGGFPQPYSTDDPRTREAWHAAYVTTIAQKDVRDLGGEEHLTSVPDLLRLLAARTGSLLNSTELSRATRIPATTLKRYLAILEAAFLLLRVPPWSGNVGRRLVKSPKIYLVDSGLIAYLLRVRADDLDGQPDVASHLVEAFVAMELVKQSSWSRVRPTLLHFRSHDGHEVDFVLEGPLMSVVGLEVKASLGVDERDFRGLRSLAAALGERFKRGYVIYLGERILPFGDKLWALPISTLWRKET